MCTVLRCAYCVHCTEVCILCALMLHSNLHQFHFLDSPDHVPEQHQPLVVGQIE